MSVDLNLEQQDVSFDGIDDIKKPQIPTHRPMRTLSGEKGTTDAPVVPSTRPSKLATTVDASNEVKTASAAPIVPSTRPGQMALPVVPTVPSRRPNVAKTASQNEADVPLQTEGGVGTKETNASTKVGDKSNVIEMGTTNNDASEKNLHELHETKDEDQVEDAEDVIDDYLLEQPEPVAENVAELVSASPEEPVEEKLQEERVPELNTVESETPSQELPDTRKICDTPVNTCVETSDETAQETSEETPVDSSTINSEIVPEAGSVDKDTVDSESSEPHAPSVPKSRPAARAVESETITPPSALAETPRKAPPRVPKKPSSKIAAFQQILEQQQAANMAPQVPTRRPKGEMPPSRVNSAFSQNLNGLFAGIPLPGMAPGGDPVAALKARKSVDESTSVEEAPADVSTDSRRSRARGPRGRKLPSSVKDHVQVNDETLGNTRKIAVQSLWKYSFKAPESEPLREEDISNSGCESETQAAEDAESQSRTNIAHDDSVDQQNDPVTAEAAISSEHEQTIPEDTLSVSVEPIAASETHAADESSSLSSSPELVPEKLESPEFDSLNSTATASDPSIISTTTDADVPDVSTEGAVLSDSEGSIQ